jgi:hypothetical protein
MAMEARESPSWATNTRQEVVSPGAGQESVLRAEHQRGSVGSVNLGRRFYPPHPTHTHTHRDDMYLTVCPESLAHSPAGQLDVVVDLQGGGVGVGGLQVQQGEAQRVGDGGQSVAALRKGGGGGGCRRKAIRSWTGLKQAPCRGLAARPGARVVPSSTRW